MKDLHFDLHGLSISIAVDDRDLRDFIKEHFEAARGANPDAELSIRAAWRWGRRPPAPQSGTDKGPAVIEKLGRGVLIARDEAATGRGGEARVIWTKVPDFPELTLAFQMEGLEPLWKSLFDKGVMELFKPE